MLHVRVTGDRIRIGRHFGLSFQRTLRIPDDGNTYPLPPGLGRFPIRRVADYARRVPDSWLRHGGVFLPMYQREAMWLLFDAPYWTACAVQVAVGKVNAITGETWDERRPLIGPTREGRAGRERRDDPDAPNDAASSDPAPQSYLVCPDQPWLDGIKSGEGCIRQFVAMPLGMGYTVEGQVTGKEDNGGLQIKVFAPKPGRFPDRPPRERFPERGAHVMYDMVCCMASPRGAEMGLAAGGRMRQKIYPDPHGVDTWDPHHTGRLFVHIVNSMMYREITGEQPPPTPVSARSYTEHGLPWFELYDEERRDVPVSPILSEVKSIKEIDAEKSFGAQQDDAPVEIPAEQVKDPANLDPALVPDGDW